MSRHISPIAARLPLFLAGLAAAVAGLTARTGVAQETPSGGPPIVTPPVKKGIQQSYQTWLGFTAAGPIADPLLMFVDLGGGFFDDMHPTMLYVRPALGVRLPHGFAVHAGYTYVPFWNAHRVFGEEHDIFEQVTYKAPLTEVDLMGRVRVEERFQAHSDMGVRLRTNAQLNVPLWRRAPLQLVLWDELFLGLNQPAPWQPELLDFNQAFVGLGWQPGPHFRTEIGYQGTIVPRRDETALIHSLSATFYALW